MPTSIIIILNVVWTSIKYDAKQISEHPVYKYLALNSIPECIRKVPSIHIFKKTLKKYLQQSKDWIADKDSYYIFLFYFLTNLLTSRGC